jgi:hypothetical protein
MKNKSVFCSIVFILLLINSCKQYVNGNNVSLINTTHLDSLYEKVTIGGREMGIIHIYSEYPDYRRVGDDDEGIACIDDAARALIFYLNHFKIINNDESLDKVKRLTEFLLYMQSDSGYFFNFIFDNYTINNTHRNSVAEASWWTWRAIWALSETYNFFLQFDKNYAIKLWSAYTKSIIALKESIPESKQTILLDGFIKPTWLPSETASDQAAIQLLILSNFYNITKDIDIKEKMNHLTNGIILMQCRNDTLFPSGAFLSWKNIWHGWGNSQSYALLKSSIIINNKEYIKGALDEINYFYNSLVNQHYSNEIKLKKINNQILIEKSTQFPQIAYMIRPMVYACLEAHRVLKDSSYAELAGKIACWLLGDNAANKQMYSPKTGVVYDGIISKNKINRNSGAESTIEGLLTILAIEQNSTAKKVFHDYFKSVNRN